MVFDWPRRRNMHQMTAESGVAVDTHFWCQQVHLEVMRTAASSPGCRYIASFVVQQAADVSLT
jgi:hypothetical protein